MQGDGGLTGEEAQQVELRQAGAGLRGRIEHLQDAEDPVPADEGAAISAFGT